jgi:aminocarboxymuconate-semialdehyde decarboxylase
MANDPSAAHTPLRDGPIDLHAHIADPSALAELETMRPGLVPRVEQVDGGWSGVLANGTTQQLDAGLFDVDVRLADMARQGIAVQAIAPWTSLFLYEAPLDVAGPMLAVVNDSMRAIAQAHPNRFVVMAGLPLQDVTASVAEIARIEPWSELAGVQISTNVVGTNLDDRGLKPVWDALEGAGLPVLVHPYGKRPAAQERLERYHLANLIGNPLETSIAIASLACGGVMARHPDLRFCFVHGGGFMPYQVGRWDHAWQVRPETRATIADPPSTFIARAWFDSLTHDAASLEFLAQRFSWSQIVIGTDYPWDMGSSDPIRDLAAAGLAGAALTTVGRDNARAFLRWPVGRPEPTART